MDRPPPLAVVARALLHRVRSGVLSTASAKFEGCPFGSLAPFAVTEHGDVALALSALAEHTKNLLADSRASLFVMDPETPERDRLASARVVLLGRAAVAEGEVLDDARARYVARHPEADEYLSKLDFKVFVLRVEQVRLVAGFGRVAWLPASEIREDPALDPLRAHVHGILADVNGTHANTLVSIVRTLRGRPDVARVSMIGADGWGFDAVAETGERFRFDFAERVESPARVLEDIVRMGDLARAKSRPSESPR